MSILTTILSRKVLSKKTIEEGSHRNRIKYLYQHNLNNPIGTFNELRETEKGLEFVAQLAIKTTLGKDVFEMMKAGVISENSVGFAPIQEEFDTKSKINHIKEVKLYEISAVTLAANPLAFINEVKSKGFDGTKEELINQYLMEKLESLTRLIKSSGISDGLAHSIEYEILSLKDLALREVVTEPIVEDHSAEELARKSKNEEEIRILSKFLETL